MGVPTSEVGYTPAMPRREDHEVHKDMWWHWTKEIHTYMHKHTDVQAHMHTYMHKHTDVQAHVRTYMHACMHTYIHTYIHTYSMVQSPS